MRGRSYWSDYDDKCARLYDKDGKMKIAITGHRPDRIAGEERYIMNWIRDCLAKMKCSEAYSGMAMGTDQIFATVAEEMGIPLICCYPYRRDNFRPAEQRINAGAKDVRFISEEYSKKSYWIRDKYMVDNCDVLLAVFDGEKVGGTWITVNYAQRIGKPVVFYEFGSKYGSNAWIDEYEAYNSFTVTGSDFIGE